MCGFVFFLNKLGFSTVGQVFFLHLQTKQSVKLKINDYIIILNSMMLNMNEQKHWLSLPSCYFYL